MSDLEKMVADIKRFDRQEDMRVLVLAVAAICLPVVPLIVLASVAGAMCK